MWHEQCSRDYKLLSQHGSDLCYDADSHVSQYKLLPVSCHQTKDKWRSAKRVGGGFSDWRLTGDAFYREVKESKLNPTLLSFVTSSLEIISFFVKMKKRWSKRKGKIRKCTVWKCHKHEDAVFIWSEGKAVAQIRDESLYWAFQSAWEGFCHACWDPGTNGGMSGTQQSLVGCWSNCLFHHSQEDMTKRAAGRLCKTEAPPSHLPSSSAVWKCCCLRNLIQPFILDPL